MWHLKLIDSKFKIKKSKSGSCFALSSSNSAPFSRACEYDFKNYIHMYSFKGELHTFQELHTYDAKWY